MLNDVKWSIEGNPKNIKFKIFATGASVKILSTLIDLSLVIPMKRYIVKILRLSNLVVDTGSKENGVPTPKTLILALIMNFLENIGKLTIWVINSRLRNLLKICKKENFKK